MISEKEKDELSQILSLIEDTEEVYEMASLMGLLHKALSAIFNDEEEPGGTHAELLASDPRLRPEVGRLQAEHRSLLDRAAQLAEELEEVDEDDEESRYAQGLMRQALRLAERIRVHEAREKRLRGEELVVVAEDDDDDDDLDLDDVDEEIEEEDDEDEGDDEDDPDIEELDLDADEDDDDFDEDEDEDEDEY